MKQSSGSGTRWGSRFGFLASAVGAAVGLGNLWAFPRRLSEAGGGTFLLVYLLLTLGVGVPLLMAELALGRMCRSGVWGAAKTLPGGTGGPGLLPGLLPLAASFCVLCFYSVVGGACLHGAAASLGALLGRPAVPFPVYATDSGAVARSTCLFALLTCGVVLLGVSGGIEQFSRIVMPLFLLLLLAMAVRSLAGGGKKAFLDLLRPDLTPLLQRPWEVLTAAGAQMLFSLSIGVGCMVTYGSYLPSAEHIPKSALIIALGDTLVALLAAAAVLPAGAGEGGPALLFLAMQRVFDGMGKAGPIFGLLFYTGAFLAAITSAISYLETLASLRSSSKGRNRAAVAAALLALTVSLLASKDAFAARSLLSFLDRTAEGVLIPLSVLCEVGCIALWWKPDRLWHELCQDRKHRGKRLFALSILLIGPLVILFVMVGQWLG